jgi:hypothetical protein
VPGAGGAGGFVAQATSNSVAKAKASDVNEQHLIVRMIRMNASCMIGAE